MLVTAAAALLGSNASAGTLSPHFFLDHSSNAAKGPGVSQLTVSVRLNQHPTPSILKRLAAVGATPKLLNGNRLAAVGTVLSMRVPSNRLTQLASLPDVARVEPASPLFWLAPLNVTSSLIGAPTARALPVNHGTLGEGILVADIEQGFDPFHPDLFRPDGGLFDFDDTNGTGKADAGDHVDLDGDGVYESALVLLEGKYTDIYTGEANVAAPGYQPDVDWLYVDTNGDSKHNFGGGAGFTDADPAMGEPIFVGDDVNRDGNIEPGERLVRLGTSKVRVGFTAGTTYRRGQNLAQFPVVHAGHGTGATGIVAMGWPELRRYTGIAPAVDLAIIDGSDDLVEAVAFAQNEGAQITLHEYDLPNEASDGSSNIEAAISQSAATGVVQLAATGNLAGVDKVMRASLTPNSPKTVALTTDDYNHWTYEYALANITWHGDANLVNVTIIGPQGTHFDVGASGGTQTVDGFTIQASRETTSQGNGWVALYILPHGGSALPNTTLSVELSSSQNVGVVQGLLFDSASGWNRGVAWMSDVTDEGTALCPSTAENVIAVTAYGGKHDFTMYGWGAPGAHRSYAGAGPRIDGEAVVDIAAPDDPFTTAAHTVTGHGSYQAFGGTSGALPHAAGAAALLVASHPTYKHADVEAAFKSTALSDGYTGNLPNEAWGYGKLRIDDAVLGQVTPDGEAPTIAIAPVGPPILGQDVIIHATVGDADGHASEVMVAWDVGYDREYEHEATLDRDLTLPFSSNGLRVVAKAIDPTGRSSRALLILNELTGDAGVDAPSEAGDASSDAGTDTSQDAPLDVSSAEASADAPSSSDSGKDAAPASKGQAPSDDGGCGCTVPGPQRGGRAWLSLLMLGAIVWRRFRAPRSRW